MTGSSSIHRGVLVPLRLQLCGTNMAIVNRVFADLQVYVSKSYEFGSHAYVFVSFHWSSRWLVRRMFGTKLPHLTKCLNDAVARISGV